jgi:hypothetical protein
LNKAAVATAGVDRSGRYAYGDGSETVAKSSSYFWSKFAGDGVASLLVAKTDDEFESAWTLVYNNFVEECDYIEARRLMAEWFKENYKP